MDLAEITGDDAWRELAARSLTAFAPMVESVPDAVRMLALAGRRYGAIAPAAEAAAAGAVAEAEPPERKARAAGSEQVRVAARLAAGDGPWRSFSIELEVAPGWHVNANPASDEFLIPTQVEEREGSLRGVQYPAGRSERFAFADRDVSIYDGTVVVSGEIEAPAGSGSIAVTYQACDDERCLAPVTVEVPLRDSAD